MSGSKLNLKKKQIRSFFLGYDKREKANQIIEGELATKGMEYIQMRLPVEKITFEFEERLRNKVEKNVLKAKIREAKEEDLESVMYIHNRAWMTSNEPFSPIDLNSLRVIFNYPETIILLARVYGNDAAFAILDLEGEKREYGIICGLGVIPRFQNKGLGTVVGMAAWNYFKKKGVKELRCEVYRDNRVSYNFIKSLGFEEYDVKLYKSEDFNIN
ncbi:MAG: GNAT family N-acetyltransferase [Candidatus Heimdallarchaeota archaeon]